MAAVHYISSAGLRIFIGAQKELKKVGGEIILAAVAKPVLDVFDMSGFTALFRILSDKGDMPALSGKASDGAVLIKKETGGLSLDYLETRAAAGALFVVGSQDKLETASYTEADVVGVNASQMPFGCGLAAMGERYDDYKTLFGEALIMGHSFFFYPAVRQPAVDFLIDAHRDPATTYQFLHGFGFTGAYRYVASFKPQNGAVDLTALTEGFLALARTNVIGVVLLAESKGLWGMNMKKPPIGGVQPPEGGGIFSGRRFADWFDFPVEPAYVNHPVAACGIAVRDRTRLDPAFARLFSEGNNYHLHGGIFAKAPLGNNVHAFDAEMARIFNDLSVYKIQHLFGQSRFAGGMAGIVELEV
jgi:hypothetical protein